MSLIPREYIIDTSRSDKELSKVTISGFNRTNVLTKMIERLRLHDVSGGNYWCAELNASNHTELSFTKLISYAASEVNIQNVRWPMHFQKLISKVDKASLHSGRNSQTVRNALAEITTILALSSKKPLKPPKIGEIDFEMDFIRSKVIAKNNSMAKQIMRSEDPKDLMLPINELASQILLSRRLLERHNDMLGPSAPRTEPFYWLAWFLEWEKHMSSKKVNDGGYPGAHRESRLYDSKFAKDSVWIVWDLLLGLADRFNSDENAIGDNVYALYRMYTMNFSRARKNEKKGLLYNAVQYLVTEVDWTRHVFVERTKVLQMVAGVNLTYERIGSGAREWEHSIRPSSIAQYIESGNERVKAICGSENVSDHELCDQVDMLLSSSAIMGPPAPVEEDESKPPMIREFESRRESYDPPVRPARSRAIETSKAKSLTIVATGTSLSPPPFRNRGLSIPVACIGGTGCFYTDPRLTRVQRELLSTEGPVNEIKEILIGLDESTPQRGEIPADDTDTE